MGHAAEPLNLTEPIRDIPSPSLLVICGELRGFSELAEQLPRSERSQSLVRHFAHARKTYEDGFSSTGTSWHV